MCAIAVMALGAPSLERSRRNLAPKALWLRSRAQAASRSAVDARLTTCRVPRLSTLPPLVNPRRIQIQRWKSYGCICFRSILSLASLLCHIVDPPKVKFDGLDPVANRFYETLQRGRAGLGSQERSPPNIGSPQSKSGCKTGTKAPKSKRL